MGENVTVFGDVADKFDALVAYDEKALDGWVEEGGYSLTRMVTASSAMAFMTFAKGFVDVGRLGNGIIIEGGVKGVGKDVLRALNFAGGAGAVIGRGAKFMRLLQAGNTCAPVAQTNALRLAGQRFLITLEELASRSGINLQAIAAAGRQSDTYTRMITAMQQMGIAVRTISQGTRMGVSNVINLIKANSGGVITFSIRTAAGAQPHRLYATFSRLGGLVIRDSNFLFKTYRSIADLEKVWGAGAIISESPIIFVPNSFITTAASISETLGGWAGLGIQLIPLVPVAATDDETALQALTVREQVAGTTIHLGAPGTVPNAEGGLAGKYHTVQPGDWLSKLAKHYYGNMFKWPVIFAANRRVIGNNPDIIRAGQKLFIPNLPHAKLIAAKNLQRSTVAVV
jgi:hypothetical protein